MFVQAQRAVGLVEIVTVMHSRDGKGQAKHVKSFKFSSAYNIDAPGSEDINLSFK